MGSVNFIL